MAKEEKNGKIKEKNMENANEKKEEKKEAKRLKKEGKKNKKKKILPKIILFFILLGGVTYFIYQSNFFGLGNKYIRPVLEKIPVVNSYLPEVSKDKTRQELLMENDILMLEKTQDLKKIEELSIEKSNNLAELERLRLLESDYLVFKEQKRLFDIEVASGDSVEYINYFESINKDTSQEIYINLKKEQVNKDEYDRYISRFEAMDSKKSATILEELSFGDMDLVITILNNISIKKSTEILENIETETATTILKRLTPVKR